MPWGTGLVDPAVALEPFSAVRYDSEDACPGAFVFPQKNPCLLTVRHPSRICMSP